MGRHVLIGFTYVSAEDVVESQEQHHGLVVRCDESGVAVDPWGGGELITLPPDLRPFRTAPPGEYRLHSTGEVVVDPDFIASWTITQPDPA